MGFGYFLKTDIVIHSQLQPPIQTIQEKHQIFTKLTGNGYVSPASVLTK